MSRFGKAHLGIVIVALALAACGTPPPPPDDADVSTTYYDSPSEGTYSVLAAAIGVWDPKVPVLSVPGATLTPALIDAGPGWWLGEPALIEDDGSVDLTFPEADADLTSALVPAADVLMGGAPEGCALTISDPSVMVTALGFEGVTVPGVQLITPDGRELGVLTDVPVTDFSDPSLDALKYYGFIYASGPLTVSGQGDDCVANQLTVDLDVGAGWSWVEWSAVPGETEESSILHLRSVERPSDPALTIF